MDSNVLRIKSTGSTNRWMQDFVSREKAEEGFVIWAEEQSAGRGHGHNTWESELGKNLTFSLLLKPAFLPPSQQFLLTQIVSLAMADVLGNILPKEKVTIKWPNDIYIGEQKAAGILVQNFIKGQSIDFSIVGIGLNVNQQHFFSDAPNPVSLVHFTGKPLDREKLLDSLLKQIGKHYGQAASPLLRKEVEKKYLSHLFRYRETSVFKVKGEAFKASISGIGKFGQLMLRHENGEEGLYDFKEVGFVL
ncbi:MAG: biotin--[acetyl-CoA-carboxylase] ligase [Bacteroidales bacterium]|nr:biotin--[acetyl-CoA-carboxylase] ligase [Bacteroidales bacterium]MCF6342383.1 biotin--[acetyl-CoA-carboxylase] ligase [Bacteroidales bacterium]